MSEPVQLTQLIDSYVDSSRSLAQQTASLDAIVLLLKNDTVNIGSLVKKMEMYLTTTDDLIRARGILLLGEALTRLTSKLLDSAIIHSLITFFKDRLADWRALHGALVGCLALMKRKSNGVVTGVDAKIVVEAYLQNLLVQSLAQHDRKLCFELLECLLEQYPEAVTSLGEEVIYGICEAIDGEKDPHCLMLIFHIVELLGKIFPDPCGPFSTFAGDLFSILGCYFPIHFTHPKSEDIDVRRDDLSRALMLAFSSTSHFEPFAMPLLLEKLSSSLPSAKVDSLKYLSCCALKFGAERMAKHAQTIWSLLKEEINSMEEEPILSTNLESQDPNSQKNEIATEALLLLEKLIVQNNDLFLSMIFSDEEVNVIFNLSSYNSYEEISSQNKQKLHMVGRILYVSAKTSLSSCDKVFERFFPCILEALSISVENRSGARHSNGTFMGSKQHNYGSLYLCIKLLEACRDLIARSDKLASDYTSWNETFCCLLKHSSTSITETFISTLAANTSGYAHNADNYLGVKGMQILATFPEGYSFLPKVTFDNILSTFLSIVTVNFNKTAFWNEALKALVHIGSFIHGCNASDKEISYLDIIVGKMILLASSADLNMPWRLKLTAIASISSSGPKYMLKIFLDLQEAVLSNLVKIYVQGDLESSKILLQLLDCYSAELLPRIQKTEGFEDILKQFVVNLWNKIETCKGFNLASLENDRLLDATMKAMKDAVACCSVESQNMIVYKAYGVVSSMISPKVMESLSHNALQLERFRAIHEMGNFSSTDEYLVCLFASVIISLHPQAQIPNTRLVLNLFVFALLKGNVTAAQALGSLVNKMHLKSNGACISDDYSFEDATDIILATNLLRSFNNGSFEKCGWTSNKEEMDVTNLCLDAPTLASLQIHAIVGLAWVGKGLIMRGHEKVKYLTMLLLNCLLSDGGNCALPPKDGSFENSCKQDTQESLMKCAADAFRILTSDSEICLNRKYHAIIRPLYKQRFFLTIMPIFQSLITKSDFSFSRSMLHRAFAHVISDTPLSVILNDAKKLIPLLLDGIILLVNDVLDKDIIYGLLLVLSGILTDKNGKEAVMENSHIIIKCLVELTTYPHMMLIRETAAQCLVAMSELPHTKIYPLRVQVLQAIKRALDDPKRVVRQEAVKCRRAWQSIN